MMWLVPIVLLTFVIILTDIRSRRIPNQLNLALFLFSLGYAARTSWGSSVAGALAGFGFFLVLYFGTKGGIGEGDIKLIPSLGLVAGFPGIIDLIFISSLLSLPFAIVFLLMKKGKTMELPYAPFRCISFYLVLYLNRGLF